MRKYTLDTSVIIHDPDCFFKFEEHILYIPKVVLNELDGLKNASGEKGMFARMAQKNIEKILLERNPKILFANYFNCDTNDDDIVETARYHNTILVSRDVGMRIKANLHNVPAEDYHYAKVREDYNGYQIIEIQDNWFINRIYAGHPPHIDELGITAVENEFIILKYESQSVMTICKNGVLHKVDNHEPYKIVGKNVEQKLALHALMDPEIQLVTLTGSAGSGKAQPLYSKILTPSGWTTMGKVYVGMEISTPDGTAKVLGIFPQGPKAIYKITTKSYKTVQCCLEHLWCIKLAFHDSNHTHILNTKDIAEKIVDGMPVYIPYIHGTNMLWEEILKIEYTGIYEAQCIYIDSKDHLYITDDCLITHNTLLTLASALAQKEKYKQILLTRPIVPLSGKDLGFLPGPQPLDAKVLGASGWTTMGDVTVGDKVIAASTGLPVDILGVFPKGKKDIYRITTIDGESTECCIDHLWLTQTYEERKRNKEGKVRSTQEIIYSLKNNNGQYNHFLPRTAPITFQQNTTLPMPPYLLGVLLGNGNFSCDSVNFCTLDEDMVNRCKAECSTLDINLSISQQPDNGLYTCVLINDKFNNKTAKRVVIQSINNTVEYHSVGTASKALNINDSTIAYRCTNNSVINDTSYSFLSPKYRWTNKAKNILDQLKLLGCKSTTKFIPKEYIYGTTAEQRLDLLRGLMDTDGSSKANGEMTFCTSSPQLAEDVIEIVKSLGGKARLRNRGIRSGKVNSLLPNYEFNISLHLNPFYIHRKSKNYLNRDNKTKRRFMHGRAIVSIEYVGKKEAQCILIDDPEHLYITDDYIVTHNTLNEKLDPYNGPFGDNFAVLHGGDPEKANQINKLKQDEKIKVEAMPYIRGRSFNKMLLIADECQNMTKHEVKTLITRAGNDTKIVLTGDVQQIDMPYMDEYTNGLSYLISKMKGQPMYAHITMKKSERSPLAELAANLL